MKLKKILLISLVMSALTACNTISHKESFCYLYTPVVFSTYEAKAAIVDNNDTAEHALRKNKSLYEIKCKE